jgi:ubiquinone/menaquinone biosynthesis C-methylase UbiE
VHDNACGTGAVSEQLLQALPNTRIYATDVVPGMVMAMKSIVDADPALQAAVAEVAVMNGQELSYADETFDASIMNFGIFFFPDPVRGAKQVYRTLKPGGTAIFTLWADIGFKPVLWAIQDIVQPVELLKELPLMETGSMGPCWRRCCGKAASQGA